MQESKDYGNSNLENSKNAMVIVVGYIFFVKSLYVDQAKVDFTFFLAHFHKKILLSPEDLLRIFIGGRLISLLLLLARKNRHLR